MFNAHDAWIDCNKQAWQKNVLFLYFFVKYRSCTTQIDAVLLFTHYLRFYVCRSSKPFQHSIDIDIDNCHVRKSGASRDSHTGIQFNLLRICFFLIELPCAFVNIFFFLCDQMYKSTNLNINPICSIQKATMDAQ